MPGGVADLLLLDPVRELLSHLGYPEYLGHILGVWKILGVAALLVPGKPRLKEWAYAGFVFDLTGAVYSHVAVGDPAREVVTPVVLLVVLGFSYRLRPESRR